MEKRLMSVLYVLLLTKILLMCTYINTSLLIGKTSALENSDIVSYTAFQDELLDVTVYEDLPIKDLAIDLGDETKADNINAYKKNGEYYFFLPKGYNRSNLRLHFGDKANVSVSIYDKDNYFITKVKNNSFTDVLSNDRFIIKTDINSEDVHTYKVNVQQSTLPSISINLENGDRDFRAVNNSVNHSVSRTGYSLVMDSDDSKKYLEVTQFKGRGNRTWERYKKPYQIKFESKVDIYGMGLGKTYSLLTNTYDGPLSRNYLFLKLALDLELPSALAIQPVELYVNNNYNGSYLLTEKVQVKKNRVETGEDDFLFEIENHQAGNDYVVTKRGLVVTIKNPDFDELNSSQRSETKRRALNYLNKLEDVIYGNCSDEELNKYIDYDSFAKFYWVQELSMNYDALRGSNYFYVKDGKLYAGPGWDFDNTLNRSYRYTSSNKGYYVLNNAALNTRIHGNWYRPLVKREGFSKAIDNIYYQYNDVISRLPNDAKEYGDFLKSSAKMNYTIYSYHYNNTAITSKDPIGANTNYNKGVAILVNHLKERVNYYKDQYEDVAFYDFKYSYVDKDGNSHDETIKDNKIKIPSYVNNITIYSNNGREDFKNDYNIEDDKIKFTLSQGTASSYKKTNSITYTFDVERG